MCFLGRELLRRACSTSSRERLAIGFLSACLAGGLFTGRLLGGFFGLILTDRGVLLRRVAYFGATCLYPQICGIGGGCHCWWLFEVGVV